MAVLGALLVLLLCLLVAPTRHLFGWLSAQAGSDEVIDTSASDDTYSLDVQDSSADGSADGRGEAHAISPFHGPSMATDGLVALEEATDAEGGPTGVSVLTGTPMLAGLSRGSTPGLEALNAGGDGGGGLSGGAFAFGGAFSGSQADGATTSRLGALSTGGSTAGFGGNGTGENSAGESQNGPRQSHNGQALRSGGGDNGDGSGDPGEASAGTGGHGSSGGGTDDGLVFIPAPGDHGPDHDDANVSVYPSGHDGWSMLSDSNDDPPSGHRPDLLSLATIGDPTPVPEPATLLLLGSNLVVAGYRLRRRSLV